LRCNAYKAAYNKDTNSIAIVVSNKVPRTVEIPEVGEIKDKDEQEAAPKPETNGKNSNIISLKSNTLLEDKPPPPLPAFDDKFELRLLSPHNWVQQDKY
jgi:hypothetical protein